MSDAKRTASGNDATNGANPAKRPFIRVPDESAAYSLDSFCIPAHYKNDLEEIVLPHGIVQDRIQRMARDIVEDHQHQPLVCLCVLKGGHQFFSDLFNEIKKLNVSAESSVPLRVDFIRCKSYENDESSGKVQVIGGDSLDSLKGENVLIVEDMIDTGRTMVKLVSTLNDYAPKSLRVASLFLKRTERSNGFKPEYVGFEVPDKFLVGYALDYNEYFRDLDHVAVLNDAAKAKYHQ
ncbi:hypoxanthine phosphoribosyltransferase 1 [Salpingoeca rosetta]|uniref:Hypoxanthine phosphoribosyltransferase n=1 Tax=Salpingoeca rosetta (strain ATCC 50818 / BSB-021) TaxID=946362 RepID=F2ULF5_SALR5|nr:hypoxanthine phosphoribosyltransferase 1 [Salpingoeca rosetta]EGD77954.1 hypoxanthine phosphoribosyltransferase 1 [Salpingoeca rosetta]|eukprot:XP_004990017.1 hypoxanthine phosphoribosyltransferase 1 [Salpingoeca rosetta]